MPISAQALAELGIEPEIEPAKGVIYTPPRPEGRDAKGRLPSDPDFDPFENTPEEDAEFERQMKVIRARRKENVERIKPKPIDPMKAVAGMPEGKSAGHAVQVSAKAKPANHNKRTKDLLEGMGYTFYKADYYDARTGRAHDLCGVFDGLAFGPDGVVGVQLTSTGNMAARRRKIQEWADLEAWKSSGAKVLLVGWKKGKTSGRFEEKLEWL